MSPQRISPGPSRSTGCCSRARQRSAGWIFARPAWPVRRPGRGRRRRRRPRPGRTPRPSPSWAAPPNPPGRAAVAGHDPHAPGARRHPGIRLGPYHSDGTHRRVRHSPPRRAGGGHGSERFGQVHPPGHRRRSRPRHQGAGPGRRPRSRRAGRQDPGRAAAPLHRVCLPGAQPAGDPHRRGERRPAAGAGRRPAADGGRPGARAARRARHGRAHRQVPRGAVRWRAATRRDRPCRGRRAPPAARRRAHRGAGLLHRGDGARAAAAPVRQRLRRGPGDPRRPLRRLGRPGRVPARRPPGRPDRASRRPARPPRPGGGHMSTSRFPRALWRMARRDLRRHLRRSALIVALVALPVAGLTAGIVLLRAASPTGAQRAADVLGAATLRVDATSPQARLDAAALPAGSRTLAFSTDGGLLRVGPGDVRRISLTDLPVRITGSVIRPADTDAFLAVAPRGALGPRASRSWLIALPAGAGGQGVLRDAGGLTVTTRQQASTSPRSVRTRTGVLDPVPIVAGLTLMIAALVAAAAFAAGVRREIRELGLLAAAGGSPAQLRAAVLARGATLGLAGGLVGLALGALAAVAVHPWLGGIVGHLPRPIALPTLPLVGVVAAAVLAGTAAAWFPARFAGRVPPVEALDARVPGGPPPRHVSRLGILAIVLGCVIAAVGVKPIDNLAVSLAGLALLLGGFVACSAALVAALEPLARHLPLAGRVATRQAARNRSRAGPAVAAIAVALAVPVFVSSVALTARGDDRAHWIPALGADQLQISHIHPGGGGGGSRQIEIRDPGSEQLPGAAVRAVLAAIPGAVAAPLQVAFAPLSGAAGSGQLPPGKGRAGASPMPMVVPMVVTARQLVTQAEEPGLLYVGGDDLLAALGARSAAAGLAAGRVVGIGPGTVSVGQVALHRVDFNHGNTGSFLDRQARVLPAVQVGGRPLLTIRYVVGAATARRLGLVTATQGTLVRAPHAITPAELAAAQAALAPYPELAADAGPGAPPQSVSTSLLLLLFAVSAAVALAVVAAMVGLAQAEAAPERRTLFAVGASPSTLRGTAAATAGLLALLGGVLAVPAGLLPLAAIYVAAPAAVPLVIPWTGLALIVMVVPALAAAGGATLTRTNLSDRALWSRS